MTEESAYVPVDGELFWADQGGQIDGLRAAVRLRLHHYVSFSLAHSYSEREGKPYSIDTWMKTPMTLAEVQRAKLPVSDGYFEDDKGQEVVRTQFEYIRDHLGYRIELQRARFPRTARAGSELTIQVELINRGFSAMHNPRPVFFTLINEQDKVKAYPVKQCDPRRWQPYAPKDPDFQSMTYKISERILMDEEFTPGCYRLGLWMPDADMRLRKNPRYAIRVANRDVPYWMDRQSRYGINLLGETDLIR